MTREEFDWAVHQLMDMTECRCDPKREEWQQHETIHCYANLRMDVELLTLTYEDARWFT